MLDLKNNKLLILKEYSIVNKSYRSDAIRKSIVFDVPSYSRITHFFSHVPVLYEREAKAALVRNYLEVYWPCAGELSAVNAIGTQLRDPMGYGGSMNGRRRGTREESRK